MGLPPVEREGSIASGSSLRARALAGVPAAFVVVLALAAAPSQLRLAVGRLRASPAGLARDAAAAARALRGDAYADLVEGVRRRVPKEGAYALAADNSRPVDENWIRCDLAPRTPVLLVPACGKWILDKPSASVPEVAVVVAAGPTRVAETHALLSGLWSFLSGPQVEIPGWIDTPPEGSRAPARVVVSGWCQERGGKPCVAVRVWVDGREVDPALVERFPRPDVAAAVPDVGDCSRAGWRTVFEPGALAPGTHCVAAALIADGGRHRRIGPWSFEVEK
jgi:hypothetical protein